MRRIDAELRAALAGQAPHHEDAETIGTKRGATSHDRALRSRDPQQETQDTVGRPQVQLLRESRAHERWVWRIRRFRRFGRSVQLCSVGPVAGLL